MHELGSQERGKGSRDILGQPICHPLHPVYSQQLPYFQKVFGRVKRWRSCHHHKVIYIPFGSCKKLLNNESTKLATGVGELRTKLATGAEKF
jgi:hypothetical protein